MVSDRPDLDEFLDTQSPDTQDQTGVTICHVSEDFEVYGGRGPGARSMEDTHPPHKGWLGNPYPASDHGRENCIGMFKRDFYDALRDRPDFANAVLSLSGRSVACYCRASDADDPACHLDVVDAALQSGHVQRIAHQIHDIPLTEQQTAEMCDPEALL
jgi:hypothetical protein